MTLYKFKECMENQEHDSCGYHYLVGSDYKCLYVTQLNQLAVDKRLATPESQSETIILYSDVCTARDFAEFTRTPLSQITQEIRAASRCPCLNQQHALDNRPSLTGLLTTRTSGQ